MTEEIAGDYLDGFAVCTSTTGKRQRGDAAQEGI